MKAGLISDEPLRVTFALYNLGVRVKHWAYIRETSPGCFASWSQLCELLRDAFLPANIELHQRSRFLACKRDKRELPEYGQAMRTLVEILFLKPTVFMDGLKVGPDRTQLFRMQVTAMERRFESSSKKSTATSWLVLLGEREHRHDEDGFPREVEHRSNAAVASAVTQPADTGAYSEPDPMD
ncbi:hypothetical protein PInf_018288 [Phytophthora infestans]|nr:hypothetical protein PInf_018288 [Phytophthora infestans]